MADRASHLLARASFDRGAQDGLPAFGADRSLLEPQIGDDRGLINVFGDLLGTTLGGDVLRMGQLRAPTLLGDPQQITSDQGYRPARALLPWRVGRRVDDHLANHTPARMVGVTAGNQKTSERFSHSGRARLAAMDIEVA